MARPLSLVHIDCDGRASQTGRGTLRGASTRGSSACNTHLAWRRSQIKAARLMAILSFGESGSLPKICFARRILYWIVFAWTNKRLAASSYDPKVSVKQNVSVSCDLVFLS